MSGDYRVVVTTRFGGARQLYRRPGGFTYRRGKTTHALMTAPQVEAAKKWAKKRLARSVRVVGPRQSLFLLYGEGVRAPTNRRLVAALNETARKRRRFIRVISGLRTPHEAWVLRMKYLSGTGNLAARCCSKYDRQKHSWADCGKNPWSNHADGNAADCGTVSASGRYRSLASDRKAKRIALKLGIVFPVTDPWEPWHAEFRG